MGLSDALGLEASSHNLSPIGSALGAPSFSAPCHPPAPAQRTKPTEMGRIGTNGLTGAAGRPIRLGALPFVEKRTCDRSQGRRGGQSGSGHSGDVDAGFVATLSSVHGPETTADRGKGVRHAALRGQGGARNRRRTRHWPRRGRTFRPRGGARRGQRRACLECGERGRGNYLGRGPGAECRCRCLEPGTSRRHV